MDIFIYTLSDPRTNEIRYVGKTDKVKRRLRSHILISQKKNSNKERTHNERWIYKLIKEGIEPELKILDIVPEDEWEFWEPYWIEQMKAWGLKLTNNTPGGTGFGSGKNHWAYGVGFSKKHCKNISKSRMGRNINPLKPVDQYDLQGNFIKTWNSIKEAGKILNISDGQISNVCRNKKRRKTAGGYIFKYKGEKLNLEDHKHEKNVFDPRSVNQYDKNGNFIKQFKSLEIAGKETGIISSVICNCCRKRFKTAGGYKWEYV